MLGEVNGFLRGRRNISFSGRLPAPKERSRNLLTCAIDCLFARLSSPESLCRILAYAGTRTFTQASTQVTRPPPGFQFHLSHLEVLHSKSDLIADVSPRLVHFIGAFVK